MLLRSPSKLNLGLRILGRRPDGYHLLESLFWPVSFDDEMRLINDGKREFRAEWAANALKKTGLVPVGADNILSKAAAHFPEFSGSINLRKFVPMGAGLGGGSSNAGTFLKFIGETLAIPTNRIEATARQLGADVPYFLNPTPAWVTGIGETRTPLKVGPSLKTLAFFLVFPPFECSTPQIFSLYDKSLQSFSPAIGPLGDRELNLENLRTLSQNGKNDLTVAAMRVHPQLEEILLQLANVRPLFSGMSGSGSTCYAAFESPAALENNLKGLHQFFRSTHCATTTVATHSVISS